MVLFLRCWSFQLDLFIKASISPSRLAERMDETVLISDKFHKILPKLQDKLLSFCNTRKENTVLNRLHIGHSYLTHSFILRKEEAPVLLDVML